MQKSKLQFKIKNFAAAFFTFLLYLLLSTFYFLPTVLAAELYFYPADQTVVLGETAMLEIRLNTEGKSINAVEISGEVSGFLDLQQVETSGSILPLVVEKPEFRNGKLHFSAAAPNGFTGDGIIGRLMVKASSEGESNISISNARAFLNSENAEEIAAGLRQAKVLIASRAPDYVAVSSKSHSEDKWDFHRTLYTSWEAREGSQYSYRLSKSPTDAPDASADFPIGDIKFDNLEDGIYYFTVCELKKDESGSGVCGTISRYRAMIDQTAPVWISADVSEGTEETGSQKFASFVASDNISGVNRYEISVNGSNFKQADSPHILVDNNVEIVVLKAFDRAGNETAKVIEIAPKVQDMTYLYILFIVAAAGLIGLIFRRKRVIIE